MACDPRVSIARFCERSQTRPDNPVNSDKCSTSAVLDKMSVAEGTQGYYIGVLRITVRGGRHETRAA